MYGNYHVAKEYIYKQTNSKIKTFFHSIVMTTCSTVLALGAMPLLLYLYCKGVSGLEQAVPYFGIVVALVMTLVPCGIGIAINHWAPRYSKLITKVNFS